MSDATAPVQTFDERHTARMDAQPAVLRTAHERLAMELALRMESPEETFKRHGLTAEQGLELLQTAGFAKLLERMTVEVRENGVSFKMKSRAIAEDLLAEVHDMATDPLVSSAVRLDAAKSVVKWAGLEPKDDKEGARGGGGLTLSITFAGGGPVEKVVQGEVVMNQLEEAK